MSLQFEKTDKPVIDLFKTSDFNFDYKLDPKVKEPEKTIYFNKDGSLTTQIIEMNGDLTPLPAIRKGSFIRFFIGGRSGSYKSSTCGILIKRFLDANDNNIFILYYNCNEKDTVLEKYLKKIGHNNIIVFTPKSFEETYKKRKMIPLTVDALNDYQKKTRNIPMLIVFDDLEACNNPLLRKATHAFMLDLLQRGRKHSDKTDNLSVINIQHTMLNYSQSVKLFNESNYCVFNLRAVPDNAIVNMLANKFGYDNNIIEYILENKRQGGGITWFSTEYPMIIFNQNAIIIQS